MYNNVNSTTTYFCMPFKIFLFLRDIIYQKILFTKRTDSIHIFLRDFLSRAVLLLVSDIQNRRSASCR